MGSFLHWLSDQRSAVAIGLSVIPFAVTLILRYGYDMWWPTGIALATVFGLIGLFAGGQR